MISAVDHSGYDYGDPPWLDEGANPVWKCDVCGRFMSNRSPAHAKCDRRIDEEELRQLRRDVERGY